MSTARLPLRLVLAASAWVVGPHRTDARADAPPSKPTLTVRAVHPDREAEAVIALFRGSRAASPAAALSAWKRASREPKLLGKVGDAAIAMLNPRMAREFATLDAAELAISFVPGPTRWEWRARAPHDDGTLDVIGPVADLSGGRIDTPIGDYRVDRFPGATPAFLARGTAGLFAASSREQLAAIIQAAATPVRPPPIDSGWMITVNPAARDSWTSPVGRRWAAAADAAGCQTLAGWVRFQRTTLLASLVGRFAGDTPSGAPLDPDWLDAIPTRGPLAAFGLRIDPRAESWAKLFNLLDRVERTDPDRANVASSRIRLALAARAVGVRLETDVWPHLVGVAGWVGMTDRQPDRGLVALHLDDPAAARGLVDGIKGPRAPDGPDEVADAGKVAGRTLRVIRRGATVFIAWGDRAWAESRAALDDPARSARPWLAKSRTGALPARVGAVWLDQLPWVPAGTPLAATLAESPPVRWAGANEGNRTMDEFWLDGLDDSVRRFLDRLPLDPPPEP